MEKQKINVTIAGRPYPFVIKPEMEEQVRAAAARIEKYYSLYVNKYKEKDAQDIVSIILLETMNKLISLESKNTGFLKDMTDKLAGLDRELGEYIEKL